jgi:REP-associated tyrosine transposase
VTSRCDSAPHWNSTAHRRPRAVGRTDLFCSSCLTRADALYNSCAFKMTRRPKQLAFLIRTHGGARPGAGRKRIAPRRGVPHRSRTPHDPRHPVHVTLRAGTLPVSLRSTTVFPALRAALARASRAAFRVIAFSVQADHLHLVVEADSSRRLTTGVQGLAIRVAKAVNRALGRRGAVWADRYHGRALTTPRAVRHAFVYVLQNWRKHRPVALGLDPCSSATWFSGWRNALPQPAAPRSPVAIARTWLARWAWRRYGLIDEHEAPRPGRGSARARRGRAPRRRAPASGRARPIRGGNQPDRA